MQIFNVGNTFAGSVPSLEADGRIIGIGDILLSRHFGLLLPGNTQARGFVVPAPLIEAANGLG